MKESVRKTKEIVKKLPVIKPHLDFLAALLSIPVLLTVIILNFSTLTKNAKLTQSTAPTPIPTSSLTNSQNIPVKSLTVMPVKTTPTPTSAGTTPCTPGIGPISIDSPTEGQTVNTNPVCIQISYQGEGYCSVVWAYKINGGPLSDYSNNSVCLYNMLGGEVNFELDVKSLVGSNTKILKRSFLYENATTSPTPSSNPTPTVTVTPSPTPSQ